MLINFKQRDAVLPSALIVLSILVLVGTLVFMLAVPAPSAAGVAQGRVRSRQQIQDEIAAGEARTQQLETAARPRLWQGDAEAVTAAILGQLTRSAKQRALKLTAFRPQRTQQLEGIAELPFSVQVSGPFPAVRAAIASLDAPGSKLALRSIQLASSDTASSAVTATLGVSAYIVSNAPATTPRGARPATGTRPATTRGGTRG